MPQASPALGIELEKLCFPDMGQCRELEDFFGNYEKAMDINIAN